MNKPITKTVNVALVRVLTADPKFFSDFPEFQALRVLKNQPQKSGGCGGCRQTAKSTRALQAFALILQGLPAPRLQLLKRRIGTWKLQYYYFNKNTSKYELRSV